MEKNHQGKMYFYTLLLICLMKIQQTQAQSVSSVSRDRSILSGGLSMNVAGSGFSGSASPRAVITMRYQSEAPVMFTGSACTVSSSSSLVCVLPSVTPPAGFTVPDVTLGQNPLLSINGDISFKIGVTFTGQTNFVEFDDLLVYADPDMSNNAISRSFNVFTNRQIVVIGRQLNVAAFSTDYSVALSNLLCSVTYLNDTYLGCQLPTDIPTPDLADGFTSIVVNVGSVSVEVGRVVYQVPVIDEPTTLPVIDFTANDFSSIIDVSGSNLLVGLDNEDYRVQIGQSLASNLHVTQTTLQCRGPSTSPTPSGEWPQHPNNYPQLIIKVPISNQDSFQYQYHAAYIRYTGHDYSTATPVPVGTPDNIDGGIITSGGNNNGDGNGDSGDNNDGDNDDNDDNNRSGGLSETSKWLIVGIAVIAAISFITLLVFCLIRNRRPRYVDEDKRSGRYLDTVGIIPSSGSSPSAPRSHYSRPSHASSPYPSASELHRNYHSRYA